MDPDAALREAKRLAQLLVEGNDPYAIEMAEAFLALDFWIRKGGYLPAAWTKQRSGSQKKKARRTKK